MATGMKIWTGVLLVSAALVSLQFLPPEVLPYRNRIPTSHEDIRARALNREVQKTNAVLQRIRWERELEAYAAANEVDGVVVRGGGDMTADAIEEFRRQLQEAAEALPRREAGAIFGAFWVAHDLGIHPDVQPRSLEGRAEYYIDRIGERPYCFSVTPTPERWMNNNLVRRRQLGQRNWVYGTYLGPCRYVVAYGMPSDPIMTWLERGALAFGAQERTSSDDEFLYGRRRGAFGITRWTLANQLLELDACLGGRADACLQMVTHPRPDFAGRDGWADKVMVESPVRGLHRRTALGIQADMLFHDLETEFGAEAFSRFWSSELEVEEAFADAFGVDMGEWITAWVDHRMLGYEPGPALTQSARFGGLLAVMIFGLLAGMWNRRRKVA